MEKEPCEQDYLGSSDVLYLEDADPSDQPTPLSIQLENPGRGTAVIGETVTTDDGSTCGEFEIAAVGYPVDFPGGGQLVRTVEFVPDPDGPSGCACFAVGAYRFDLDTGVGCETETVTVVATGRCDQPLYCDTEAVDFSNSIVDATYTVTVTCHHLETDGQTVARIGLSGNSASSFTLGDDMPDTPIDLELADSFSFAVSYTPFARGEDTGEVVIGLTGGDEMRIPIRGTAQTERPLCEDGMPDLLEPALEVDNYVIALESTELSFYPGRVSSQLFYDEEPPMISDILITTGDFSDPMCEVSQSGHRYNYMCDDVPDGTIHNIHAVPQTEHVARWVRSLDVGDEVTIVGYEVERIDYDTEMWWTDAGCNTLIITWICDGNLP